MLRSTATHFLLLCFPLLANVEVLAASSSAPDGSDDHVEPPEDLFSTPQRYSEVARDHNERFRRLKGIPDPEGKPTPPHIVFDAIAKTEFSAALTLMTDLVTEKKFFVTYVVPGGFLVRRQEGAPPFEGEGGDDDELRALPTGTTRIAGGHFYIPPSSYNNIYIPPHDDSGEPPVLPEHYEVWHAQSPNAPQLKALRSKGVRVLIKPQSPDGAVGVDKAWWSKAFFSTREQPSPDFVVSDALSLIVWNVFESEDPETKIQQNAFTLFRLKAGLPGATWCGNKGLLGWAPTQTRRLVESLTPFFRTAFPIRSAPVFVANFLGWEEQPHLNGVAALPLPSDYHYTDTHTWLSGSQTSVKMAIPVTMVSQLGNPKTPEQNSLAFFRFEHQNLGEGVQRSLEATCSGYEESEAVRNISTRLAELRATRLIFIAFGTQGFQFSGEALEEIVLSAAAVPSSLVYLVLPEGWMEVVGVFTVDLPSLDRVKKIKPTNGRGFWLPENVTVANFPQPQREIFEAFGPQKQEHQDIPIQLAFLSHGGAGSLSEAMSKRIPVACFGLGADQPFNCDAVGGYGLGVSLRRPAHRMRVVEESIQCPGGQHSALAGPFQFLGGPGDAPEWPNVPLPAAIAASGAPLEHQDLHHANVGVVVPGATGSFLELHKLREGNTGEFARQRSLASLHGVVGLALFARVHGEKEGPLDIYNGLSHIFANWNCFQRRITEVEKETKRTALAAGQKLAQRFERIVLEEVQTYQAVMDPANLLQTVFGVDGTGTSVEYQWWSWAGDSSWRFPQVD